MTKQKIDISNLDIIAKINKLLAIRVEAKQTYVLTW